MDYYRSMQNAVDHIERRLHDELEIADIAAAAGFSSFHFQRLFQAITGFTVRGYIRHRRLTEAAAQLRGTDTGILDIAVACGYGSQEAFTRAFEQFAGLPPGEFRRAGETGFVPRRKIDFLERHRHAEREGMNVDKPDIVRLDPIAIAGREYRTTLEEGKQYADIPGFYFDFGQQGYFLRIPNRAAPDMAYGIACKFADDGGFSFIVGEQVSEIGADLDPALCGFVIPGGTYAVFRANGDADTVRRTREYVYGTWLPNSNYERTDGPDFEVTDVMRSSYPDAMRMNVYIPLQ
ncbi:AraC family transcriptional regulator [Paenibacillus flagellatus]|uniref:AraC family transcriptional regulator n=1 Tax=Paenibacillus flagellatus TaxID=2211139 RepID=A0A2V5KG62_9BACL|nr:AraC family transcriptional regulator [Paenibacillus flagellatus]PYI57594.1 AraC family transcriptional regulator [Paenibacillus flagellatus]